MKEIENLLSIALVFLIAAVGGQARAQMSSQSIQAPGPDAPADVEQTSIETMWRHSNTSRFWISGQSNIIFQAHPAFHAPYSGANSLSPRGEYKTSLVNTLYLGFQASKNTELFLDFESAGGRGISQAFGIAGFTNLDVVRNPKLSAAPYVARVMLHQIIPLNNSFTESTRGPLSLATQLPTKRLEFRIGKFGVADFFDLNSVGSDSHLQFMNWTIDNNGAYDYAADTRGYTYGATVEFQSSRWGMRFGEMLMPKVANGIDLVWNLRRARAENFELEIRRSALSGKSGVIRLLSYVNHANMGAYREANTNFVRGFTSTPDITAHPLRTVIKYGFGVNVEQEITDHLRLFARWGWNEGQHESYTYTEVNGTIQLGGDYRGEPWGRAKDKVGIAVASNGISADHARYLALGGMGFLLGDGALNYGREDILETYYNAHLWRGMFIAPNIQYVIHPGYNRDRGPVLVPGLRLHLEF